MIGLAFAPNERVCKLCDGFFPLHPDMVEGEVITCECGAKGTLSVFPCGKPGCDCGGWFGVAWEGINYENAGRDA